MAEITQHRDGAFSWTDLMSTDTAAAKTFLSALFGWKMVDTPMGDDMVYTMCQLDGKNVAALHNMPAQMPEGTPSSWQVYVNTDDVDARYAAAVSAGASTMMPPSQIMENGRCAMLKDPTGAIFGLWEAQNHIGAQLHNIPGTIAWNELLTTNPAMATDFYQKAIGWGTIDNEMPNGTTYTMLTIMDNGEPAAIGGMMQMPEEIKGVPSHWGVYFNVFDVAESTAKAEELGANVLMPPTDMPNVGTMSLIHTPSAGSFTLFKSAN